MFLIEGQKQMGYDLKKIPGSQGTGHWNASD